MFLKPGKALILLAVLGLSVTPQILANQTIKPRLEIRPKSKSYGGTLMFGSSSTPVIVNPILIDSSISMSVMTLVFNRLVQYDPQGEIQPDLAESWGVSLG